MVEDDKKVFTTVHCRHILKFLFDAGYSVVEAIKFIESVYGNGVIGRTMAYKWFKRFEEGEFDLSDKKRDGRPRELNLAELENLIVQNPKATTRELESILDFDHTTIYRGLIKLEKVQKWGTWVPKELTEFDKNRRVVAASTLLKLHTECVESGKLFFERIVTGDEKWVLYLNNENRKEWRGRNEDASPRVKDGLHPKKILLSIWWDIKGPIYYELLPLNQTINAEKYICQLMCLKNTISRKRPNLEADGVILQHDNARPHTAKSTKEALSNLHWEVLPHPPYSPDIAPSDYYLFRSMASALRGTNFTNKEEVEVWINDWLNSKPQAFYERGIRSLFGRWETIVESGGEYLLE